MNPKYLSKVQELLWFGVPKNKRDKTRSFRKSQYIDPAHVMYVACSDISEDIMPEDLKSYSGDVEQEFKAPALDPDGCETVILPTEYLRGVLDNLTGDSVVLTIKKDYPIVINGTIDTCHIIAAIAPRVESE